MASDENGKSEDSQTNPTSSKDEEVLTPKEKVKVPSEKMDVIQIDSSETPTEVLSTDNHTEMESMDLTTTATASESENVESLVATSSSASESPKEMVEFKVIFNKKTHNIVFPWDDTVGALKQHIQSLTGVPTAMQKVMFKGLAKDEKTLRDLGVTKGAKVMVVGSTLTDVLAVNTPTKDEAKEEKGATGSKEPLCKQKMHKKIIDKGVPEDAMPGIKNTKDSLPHFPLSGMLNKSGGKVRLTFKLEMDQIWIGTKERTDKIPMNSIKNIANEAIEGHEEYHILGIQLGPTEASRYWIYWFPAQYVDAIKDAVLGKWQYF